MPRRDSRDTLTLLTHAQPGDDPMTTKFTYEPHERVQERLAEGPVVTHAPRRPPRSHRMQRINAAIGLRITQSVGTMWAAYAFMALTLVSLPAAIMSGNAIIIVAWIAQTFLQLVLLPIIIVGQNIQAKASDARSLATYKDAGAILDEAARIQKHLEAQDRAMTHILDQVMKLQKQVSGEVDELAAVSKPKK